MKNTQQEETRSQFNQEPHTNEMPRPSWRKRRYGRRRDRLDAIGWASVFIWGALVLMIGAIDSGDNFNRWDGWGLFLTGVGSILLIVTAIRWLVPRYRRRGQILGLIFGLILVSIGLGKITVWLWALLLVAIGIRILHRLFANQR